MTTKYWCMGCGAWGETACERVGHLTQRYSTDRTGTLKAGGITIAAVYQDRLRHLKVTID